METDGSHDLWSGEYPVVIVWIIYLSSHCVITCNYYKSDIYIYIFVNNCYHQIEYIIKEKN
jgi:hypothetical protein